MLESDLESMFSMLSYCWNAPDKVEPVPLFGPDHPGQDLVDRGSKIAIHMSTN